MQFVSVYIDDNNSSDPNTPPRYLRTRVVDSGTSGRFLDKPWVISDIPRGLASCTIPAGPGGQPAAQTIQTGVVYAAYATFLGSGNNPHSNIWVRSSNDCGATWSNGSKVTESIPLSQSPVVVVNPLNGNLHVIWREFGQGGSADRILTATSTNGARTFSKVAQIDSLGVPQPVGYWPSGVSSAFDQTTLPNAVIADVRMARTNGYPSACFGTDGRVRVVFTKRIPQPRSRAKRRARSSSRRIMLATSTGSGWTIHPDRQPSRPGPSVPAIDRLHGYKRHGALVRPAERHRVLAAADAVGLLPVRDRSDSPAAGAHGRRPRGADRVRTAASPPGPRFRSRQYPLAYDTASQRFVQLQYNYINWALFGGGVVPFLGDYLEIVPRNPFTPPLCPNAACTELTPWAINDFANESPLTHGIWTDNRDILQTSGDIGPSTGPTTPLPVQACTPGRSTWTRNQNLYSSLLGGGVIMQAEGNARRTKDLEKRAYVVQMQNLVPPKVVPEKEPPEVDPKTLKKRLRLTFAGGSGEASFSFETDFTDLTAAEFNAQYGRPPKPVVTTAYVDLPYCVGRGADASSSARTRPRRWSSSARRCGRSRPMARRSRSRAVSRPRRPARCWPAETRAASSSRRIRRRRCRHWSKRVTMRTSRFFRFRLASGAIANSVTYPSPVISAATVLTAALATNLLNPTWTSPTWTNPTWTSPTWTSPTWTSPTWTSPTWTSPTWTSPTWTSPTWTSPTWTSQPVITEASYLATAQER